MVDKLSERVKTVYTDFYSEELPDILCSSISSLSMYMFLLFINIEEEALFGDMEKEYITNCLYPFPSTLKTTFYQMKNLLLIYRRLFMFYPVE